MVLIVSSPLVVVGGAFADGGDCGWTYSVCITTSGFICLLIPYVVISRSSLYITFLVDGID